MKKVDNALGVVAGRHQVGRTSDNLTMFSSDRLFVNLVEVMLV